MTYLERMTLARNRDFISRVQYAMLVRAMEVLEADSPAPEHLALAKLVRTEPERYAVLFAQFVVTIETVTAEISDADLLAATTTVLLAMAK